MCVLWMLFITTLMLSKALAVNVSNSSRELKALKDFGWPYSNFSAHHCYWEGITCDDHGRVAEISLQTGCDYYPWKCHDVGYLDPLVFTSLTTIHLTSCGLYGDITPHIGYLSNLSYLNLSNNILDSELPLSLANLSELRVLDISHNYNIIGFIPPEIGSLSKLTHLYLSYNRLQSDLPLSLENLTNLEVLDISYNSRIHGVIPHNIGSLSKLTHLDLSYNQLQSELPLSLSNLTNLEVLLIFSSSLFGSLPSGIGYLLHLIELDLSTNGINGSLPATMSRLTRLEILNLDSNRLEGVFEAGIHMLPSIKTISLSRNSIKEQIPLQFGYVANAQYLNIDLSWNHLFGEVPESISRLEGLDLSYNNLNGHIPPNVWDKFSIDTFRGNPKLILPVAPMGSRINVEIIWYLLPGVVVVVFICCGVYLIFSKMGRKETSKVTPDLKHGDIFKIWNFDGNIAYQDIIQPTGAGIFIS